MNCYLKLLSASAAICVATTFDVHAQVSTPATSNPFADMTKSVPPPLQQALPQAQPAFLPPPPTSYNGPDPFERLAVLYVFEGNAQLRIGTPGVGNDRTYSVHHGVRAYVAGRWVVPAVENGKVTLFSDSSVADAKSARQKGDPLWVGFIQTQESSPLSQQQTDKQPVVVGSENQSPSKKAIGGSGVSLPTVAVH